MRTVAIIQARTGSSRLPGKVLAPIQGRPLILHVLDRVSSIRGLDDVCVTIPSGDWELRDALLAYGGVTICHGPENDVLRRYVLAAEQLEADVVLRVTADCCFVDPHLAEVLLELRKRQATEYASNDIRVSGFPDGLDLEVVTTEALQFAAANVEHPHDREHVTTAIREVPRGQHVLCRSAVDYSTLKLSVDTAEDLARVRTIAAHLPPGAYRFEHTLAAAERAGVWNPAC